MRAWSANATATCTAVTSSAGRARSRLRRDRVRPGAAVHRRHERHRVPDMDLAMHDRMTWGARCCRPGPRRWGTSVGCHCYRTSRRTGRSFAPRWRHCAHFRNSRAAGKKPGVRHCRAIPRLGSRACAAPPAMPGGDLRTVGSGKTSLARAVAAPLGALHVRSDVERKRLAGLGPLDDSRSPPDGGIYSRDFTEQTYARLQDCATSALLGGESMIVDAAFLKRDERRDMLGLRATNGRALCHPSLRAPLPCCASGSRPAPGPGVMRPKLAPRSSTGNPGTGRSSTTRNGRRSSRSTPPRRMPRRRRSASCGRLASAESG